MTHVLIAGAGPVGLSTALALAREGVQVSVFEAGAALADEARASTFHPPTLEMFDEWGVADDIIDRGFVVDRLQFWEREPARLVAEFPYRLLAAETRFPFRLQCPQHQATPVLLAALGRYANAEVHFEHCVVDHFEQDGEVRVAIDTPSGAMQYCGDYLVGADGAGSAVRSALGMELVGDTYEDRFLLVGGQFDVHSRFPDLGPVAYVFDPDEWAIFMQLPEYRRIVFRLDADEDAELALRDVQLGRRLAALLGPDARRKVELESIYCVHRRVADRFHVGRVLLAGDAAHINNPAGGMGMNSGIHDAYALADALIDGSEVALDHYASSRRRAALACVQTLSDDNYRSLAVRGTDDRVRRNARLVEAAASERAAAAFLRRMSMLDQPVGKRIAA